MLENRLRLGREMLSERSSIFVRCDYNGNWIVRPLMNEIFGAENFRNEIVISRISKQDPKVKRFNTATDSLFFYSKTIGSPFNLLFKNWQKTKKKDGMPWIHKERGNHFIFLAICLVTK